MMKKLTIDDGSFRDPDARVAHFNDSIYRIVYPSGFIPYFERIIIIIINIIIIKAGIHKLFLFLRKLIIVL